MNAGRSREPEQGCFVQAPIGCDSQWPPDCSIVTAMEAVESLDAVTVVSGYIAIAAFILAVVSLIWQMRRSWWEKPVLIVSGTQRALGSDTKVSDHELKMVVTNVGERPVTLLDFGWYYGAGTHSNNIERPEVSVTFPRRLDPHDFVELAGTIDAESAWNYVNQPLMVADHDRNLYQGTRPFVLVVRRPTRRELKRGDPGIRRVDGKPQIIYFTVGI